MHSKRLSRFLKFTANVDTFFNIFVTVLEGSDIGYQTVRFQKENKKFSLLLSHIYTIMAYKNRSINKTQQLLSNNIKLSYITPTLVYSSTQKERRLITPITLGFWSKCFFDGDELAQLSSAQELADLGGSKFRMSCFLVLKFMGHENIFG